MSFNEQIKVVRKITIATKSIGIDSLNNKDQLTILLNMIQKLKNKEDKNNER